MAYLKIIFSIALLSLIFCGKNPTDSPADNRIPQESAWHHAVIEYKTLPSGFSAVVPWMAAVHNDAIGSVSTVEIRSLKLYSTDINNQTTLLVGSDYSHWDSISDGGLYQRYPWFGTDVHEPMPAQVNQGVMNFTPSDRKDRVWHWWTLRANVPQNIAYITIEAEVKISGGACVQAGADWWKDLTIAWAGLNVNNKEVGVSDWYFADTGCQTIRITTKQ